MSGTRLVSVMLPSRGRVDQLKASLASLEQTVTNAADVEVLVRADDDDRPTIDCLRSVRCKFHVSVVVGPRGNGYADLHLYYNRLCEIAQGRFLFLWNDDALMLTPAWDAELAKHDDGRLCYVKSGLVDSRGRDSYLFPIVHRSYWEALGHFSLSAHNDTYVIEVLKDLPQVFRDSAITVKHVGLELIAAGDKTSMEAKQWWPTTKGMWRQPELLQAIATDNAKLKALWAAQQASAPP